MSVYLKYSLILFSIFAGLTIYLIWRDTSSIFYQWAVQLGWSDNVQNVRDLMSSVHMPAWFVYALPDGLWMFAFVLFMMAVWDFRFSGPSRVWILASVFAGLFFEIGQAFISGMGAFDWMDMICMAVGAILPILLFTKNKVYEKVF